MDTIFDVLFATPAFTRTLLAHDDLAPLDCLARLPNHSIRFATLGLLDDALRDASPFHALHTSSASLSAPVLRVLLAWVLRHANTPSALEYNVFICCDAARSAAAQAVVEAGLAHWARTAHRHPYQHLQVCKGRRVWLANIKRWRGYEADVFPHYVQEIHTLRHVVHACSPEVVFDTAEQTARYVRLVNLHHEHRTVPDAIVLALEHVCGLFAEHGPLSAPHSTICFTALRALVECCCLLDLFAPQLRRVLSALQVFARTCSVPDLAVCLDLMRCAHESAGPVSCTKPWPDNYTALCRLGEIVFTRFRSKTSYLDFQTAMAAIAPLCMLPWSLSEALTKLATSVIWLECVGVGPRHHVDVAGVYVVLQSLPACVPSRHLAQITRAALRAVCRGQPWDLTVIDCWYLSLVLQFAAHRVPFSELMRRGTRGVFLAGVNAVIGMFTRDPASLGSEIVQLRVAYYTATLVEVLVREAAVQRTRRRLWVEVLMVVLRQVGARPAALGVATAYSIVVILVKAVQSARCMDVAGVADVLAEVPEGLVRAYLEECVVVRGPPPVPWGESAVFLREVGAVRRWSAGEGPGWFVQGVQRLVERAPEVGALMAWG